MLWSFAFFFCLLAGYYILRPLRDEMGVAGGGRNLQWLVTPALPPPPPRRARPRPRAAPRARRAPPAGAVPRSPPPRARGGPALGRAGRAPAAPALHSAGLPLLRRQPG